MIWSHTRLENPRWGGPEEIRIIICHKDFRNIESTTNCGQQIATTSTTIHGSTRPIYGNKLYRVVIVIEASSPLSVDDHRLCFVRPFLRCHLPFTVPILLYPSPIVHDLFSFGHVVSVLRISLSPLVQTHHSFGSSLLMLVNPIPIPFEFRLCVNYCSCLIHIVVCIIIACRRRRCYYLSSLSISILLSYACSCSYHLSFLLLDNCISRMHCFIPLAT